MMKVIPERLPATFTLFGFPIIWLEVYPMKVIPERIMRTTLYIYVIEQLDNKVHWQLLWILI